LEEIQSTSTLSEDLDLQISSLRKDIEHKQNVLESHAKELQRVQAEEFALDGELESLSKSLKAMSDAIAVNEIDIQSMNDEHVLFLSRTELDISESTKSLSSINEAIVLLEREYTSRQEDLQDADSRLESVRSEKNTALSLIKSYDAEMDSMQKLRENIRTQTSDVKLEIKSLEKVFLDLKHISLISAAWISSKEANILLMKDDINMLVEEVRISSDALSESTEKASQTHSYLQHVELEV
jgi:chromosome segregation ATPase